MYMQVVMEPVMSKNDIHYILQRLLFSCVCQQVVLTSGLILNLSTSFISFLSAVHPISVYIQYKQKFMDKNIHVDCKFKVIYQLIKVKHGYFYIIITKFYNLVL